MSEVFPTECENGVDDDGDGGVDLGDAGCSAASDLFERDPNLPCDDGLDDDGDGRIDHPADPVCRDAVYFEEGAECQDGVDNDRAEGIDFDGGASFRGGVPIAPPDLQRVRAWYDREANPEACGVGAELAVALAALARWRRRRG